MDMRLSTMTCVLAAALCLFPCAKAQTTDGAVLTLDEALLLARANNRDLQHVRPSSLLKRFATVDEVAAMAIYLAGEVSSATSGAALRVDGGVVRAIL
jgi:enoyl-[acyl-carrier-protein] reductase (NADH)